MSKNSELHWSALLVWMELSRLGISPMILTTHAVIGAALASFVPEHPAVAFVVGFGSHVIWTRFHMLTIPSDPGP
jgi:hypothetical protein